MVEIVIFHLFEFFSRQKTECHLQELCKSDFSNQRRNEKRNHEKLFKFSKFI